jgi:hypothetical protein
VQQAHLQSTTRCENDAGLRKQRQTNAVVTTKWHVGTTNWHVGTMNWHVGTMNWHVGKTKWHVGTTKWHVSTMNWHVGWGKPGGPDSTWSRRWWKLIATHTFIRM